MQSQMRRCSRTETKLPMWTKSLPSGGVLFFHIRTKTRNTMELARRREVRNANRGSISSKLVASPSSVDIVVDIVVDNVVDNNGPASFRHTSNMWVNPPSSSSSSSSLLLLLLVVLLVVVLPWRWWCSRRMVCVTRFKSHPKRRRWMVAMPSFFLFVCTKSFKMQFRSRLLRATTMASSSNTRLRKYWQNKS